MLFQSQLQLLISKKILLNLQIYLHSIFELSQRYQVSLHWMAWIASLFSIFHRMLYLWGFVYINCDYLSLSRHENDISDISVLPILFLLFLYNIEWYCFDILRSEMSFYLTSSFNTSSLNSAYIESPSQMSLSKKAIVRDLFLFLSFLCLLSNVSISILCHRLTVFCSHA